MNITTTQRPPVSRVKQNTAPQIAQKPDEEQPPMTTADKVALGGTLVSMGGLATSIGTFVGMEAGLVPKFSTAEMWGGLGGMALFVGGAAVAGIAIIASKNN